MNRNNESYCELKKKAFQKYYFLSTNSSNVLHVFIMLPTLKKKTMKLNYVTGKTAKQSL